VLSPVLDALEELVLVVLALLELELEIVPITVVVLELDWVLEVDLVDID
jgi:hypothetical protein